MATHQPAWRQQVDLGGRGEGSFGSCCKPSNWESKGRTGSRLLLRSVMLLPREARLLSLAKLPYPQLSNRTALVSTPSPTGILIKTACVPHLRTQFVAAQIVVLSPRSAHQRAAGHCHLEERIIGLQESFVELKAGVCRLCARGTRSKQKSATTLRLRPGLVVASWRHISFPNGAAFFTVARLHCRRRFVTDRRNCVGASQLEGEAERATMQPRAQTEVSRGGRVMDKSGRNWRASCLWRPDRWRDEKNNRR